MPLFKKTKKQNRSVRLDNALRYDTNSVLVNDQDSDWWDYYQVEKLKEDYKKLEQSPEGYLSGRAVATTVGIFPYLTEDGTIVRELRHPKEVFHPDSIASLKNVPITNDHPTELVKSDNIKKYQVGSVGDNIMQDNLNGFVSVPITIQEDIAVEDVKNGKRALSCGYECNTEYKSGVWGGMAYDAVQTNIRYNHLAIVDAGRAGDDAVMKMDGINVLTSKDSKLATTINNDDKQNKGDTMDEEIKLDGITLKGDRKLIEHYEAKADKLDIADKEIEKLNQEKADLQEKIDASEAKLELLATEKTDMQAKLDDSIPKADLALVLKNKAMLDGACAKFKVELKGDESDSEIKKAVVIAVKGDKHTWLEKESTVSAIFDMIMEDDKAVMKADEDNKQELGGTVPNGDTTKTKVDALKEAQMKADEADRNAWKENK